MQSMIKLARVAFRTGTKRDLHALWSWGYGVTGENGETELLSEGLLHRDKIDLVGEHYFHQKFLQEHHNAWVPGHLNSFLELHLVHALYEGPILFDFLFLRALAKACQGKEFKPHRQLQYPFEEEGRKKTNRAENIQTPQLFKALKNLQKSLDGMPKRKGILRRDKERIVRLAQGFYKPDFKIKDLRDAVGHAKYEVAQDGIVFDIYEHLFLSLFDDYSRYKTQHGKTRRGHAPHPYKKRSVNRSNTEQMIRHAIAIHICVWAAYEEFRMQWIWKVDGTGERFTSQLARPDPNVVDWARERLRPLRVRVAEKRKAIVTAQKERALARSRIAITTRVVKAEGPPK